MTGEAVSDLVWSFGYKSCSVCFRVSSGRCFAFAGKLVCFKQILTCVSSKRPDDVEHSISEQSVFWCISNQASLFSAHLNSAKTFVIHPDHLMSPFSQQLLLLSYFQRGCHSGYYCIFDLVQILHQMPFTKLHIHLSGLEAGTRNTLASYPLDLVCLLPVSSCGSFVCKFENH